jgi:hypothetical protein
MSCSGKTTTTPTAPDGQPIQFAGTVGFKGTSIHDLVLPDDSLLSVTLTELQVLLFDSTQGPPGNITIGLGIGQREEGECKLTANFIVSEGQLTIFRLSKNAYCLTIFDPGFFPEDSVFGYRLEVEITN